MSAPVCEVSSLPVVGIASVRFTEASATWPRYQPQPLVASRARERTAPTTRATTAQRRVRCRGAAAPSSVARERAGRPARGSSRGGSGRLGWSSGSKRSRLTLFLPDGVRVATLRDGQSFHGTRVVSLAAQTAGGDGIVGSGTATAGGPTRETALHRAYPRPARHCGHHRTHGSHRRVATQGSRRK